MNLIALVGSVPAAIILVLACTAPTVAIGVWVARRGDGQDRSNDNVVRIAAGVTGLLFSLLVAATLGSELQARTEARGASDVEAQAFRLLGLEAEVGEGLFDAVQRERARYELDRYADAVLHDEIDHLASDSPAHDSARDALLGLFTLTERVEPRGTGAGARYSQLLGSVQRLAEARSRRVSAAAAALPRALWVLIGVTAASLLLVAALYPRGGSVRLKVVETVVVGVGVGFALYAVATLENPYVGAAKLDAPDYGIVESAADPP